ncbi:TraR/DksA family transcriptional regulator [Patescibacteria group bacterium]
MDKTLLQQMTKKLAEEKKQLEGQLEELAGFSSSSKKKEGGVQWTEIGSKDDENAAEVTTYQDKLSLETNLRNSLEDVNAALEKIDAGTYGVCSSCGNEIQMKRLEIVPSATLCIECRNKKQS